jgi:hypothetical protein
MTQQDENPSELIDEKAFGELIKAAVSLNESSSR